MLPSCTLAIRCTPSRLHSWLTGPILRCRELTSSHFWACKSAVNCRHACFKDRVDTVECNHSRQAVYSEINQPAPIGSHSVTMPSPAVQKLETLPLTPLQSAPTSPATSSLPSSRRGSSNIASSSAAIQQFRKQSHGAYNAARPNIGALSAASNPNDRRSAVPTSLAAPLNAASNTLTSLSSIKPTNASGISSAGRKEGEATPEGSISASKASQGQDQTEQVTQAVEEEQMLPQLPNGSNHVDSALDDEDSTDEEADIDGVTRTGNARFRSGSRRLSRLSSTLGEGITAHWKKPHSPSPAEAAPGQPSPGVPTAMPPSILKQAIQNDTATHTNLIPSPLPPSAGLPNIHAETQKSASAQAEETLSPIEQAKRLAAYRAVDVHIKPHHRVIGIGSGSTVPYVVDRLLEQGEEANKKRWVSCLSISETKAISLTSCMLRSLCQQVFNQKSLSSMPA